VHTLLLDKTGTITLGNRQAVEFVPLGGVDVRELADAAQCRASLTRRRKDARSSSSPRQQFQIPRPRGLRQVRHLHTVLGL
jgi:K+-transporting ATPase ATPase B chain